MAMPAWTFDPDHKLFRFRVYPHAPHLCQSFHKVLRHVIPMTPTSYVPDIDVAATRVCRTGHFIIGAHGVGSEPANSLYPAHLVGNAEFVLRCATKAKCVKLKMSFLGVVMEKCAISMA
ncbi:hypothetical protein JVU11DRAFT_10087 [Chiua virens]|nr:hypothetical protein JVU11DRAFT_10087 [Chiua virens]